MAPSSVAVGRLILIWMVAATAGVGLIGQAVVAFIWGPRGATLVWAISTVMVIFTASQAEKIKWFLED